MRNPVEEKFKELWGRSGPDRLTRAQIAEHFGKSLYWVQWMFVRTNVKPRNLTPQVKLRQETGKDDRREYMASVQKKTALVAITKKMVTRVDILLKTPVDYREYVRRLSDTNRVIMSAQRYFADVSEVDPDWDRLQSISEAIKSAKRFFANAEKKLRNSL
jgi:hypothetical protein